MKSCFGLLITLLVFTLVVGGGFLIWYLSDTAEFTRKGVVPNATSAAPPRAIPVSPPRTAAGRPPVAIPVKEPGRR